MPDPQAPEIAAQWKRCIYCGVAALGGELRHNPKCCLIPIAPQETMRETEVALTDLIENHEYEIPAWIRTCLRGIRQNVAALGQSHSPATVDEWQCERCTFVAETKAEKMAHQAGHNNERAAPPATVERELMGVLRKCRIFIQHAVDIKNTFAVGEALLAAIDKALATASQPVDGEERK